LLTVELAFGDAPFELPPSLDVIQVRTRDVMWQKERLLRVGMNRLLDRGFKKIAWLDADIQMTDPFWVERASALLDEVPLCQLFSESVRLGRSGESEFVRRGVAADFSRTGRMRLRGLSSGYAWAARSDLLLKSRFFDEAILGGGDAAIWLGALSGSRQFDWRKSLGKTRLFKSLGPAMQNHFLLWAKEFGTHVGGSVGFIEQTVYSFYHGNPDKRFYGQRYEWVKNLDPEHDLKVDDAGCWNWTHPSHPYAATVAGYFAKREEDG